MRLKNSKIAKKIVFDLKNIRRTSAHFRKHFFFTLWILLYPVNKKLDRPNELQQVKNTRMSHGVPKMDESALMG